MDYQLLVTSCMSERLVIPIVPGIVTWLMRHWKFEQIKVGLLSVHFLCAHNLHWMH